MGLFKSIRKARTKAKAEIKAAQAHARKLAKEEAKQDFRTAKLLDKAEKRQHMNPVQQRLAHNSIDEDLQKLSAEVQKKLN